MKKKFLLVGVIAIFGLSAFLTSCEKDEPEEKSCVCTERNPSGAVSTGETYYPSSWGAKDCSELQVKLRVEALRLGYDNVFSCR